MLRDTLIAVTILKAPPPKKKLGEEGQVKGKGGEENIFPPLPLLYFKPNNLSRGISF